MEDVPTAPGAGSDHRAGAPRPRRGDGPGRVAAFVVAAGLGALAAAGARADRPSRPDPLVEFIRRSPTPEPGRCLEVRYEGVLDYAGHYRRPGDTRRYLSSQRFLSNGRGVVRLDWTTRQEGDTSAAMPETYLVIGDTVLRREEPGANWERRHGDKAEGERIHVWSAFPWEYLRDPRVRDPRAPDVVPLFHPRRHPGTLFLEGPVGERSRRVAIDSVRARVTYVEDRRSHPRLGDIVDRITCHYGASAFPDSITYALYQRDAQWTMSARRVMARTDADDDSLLAVPATFETSQQTEDSMKGEPELVRIAPGVWAADMVDLDTRSLIVEFRDHLAVVECAVGSANGERLVDAVKRRWPDKPIRYALFSHHHPHYTGGLRALIAEGATVITTPGNEAYVRGVAALSFRSAPDRLQRSPRPVEVVTFEGRHELADSTQRLVAVDIGARSDHTDEFALFWLPKSKVLFQAEQGWVSVNDTLRAARRAVRLLQTLDEEGIDAERFVQSWPMRGTAREVTRRELEALIRKRKK